jgi:hypothetical protein
MSETDKPPASPPPLLREWAVFLGWITGIVLIGGAAWFLTQPLRDQLLMDSVNRILIQREDPRRLSAPLAVPRSPGFSSPLGRWYFLENSRNLFFVFTLIGDGPLSLCGALVSPEGKVEELLPLSGHAGQTFAALPRSMKQVYIHRIEALGFPPAGENNE